MAKNEYIKAQELAIEGHPLTSIKVKKAAKDKAALTVDQINKTVEARIDKYITENVLAEIASDAAEALFEANKESESIK